MIIVNNRRTGYLSLKHDDTDVFIENIQLSPSVHGRGIGTHLLNGIVQQYRYKTIHLTTFVDNPAKRLYERMGFTLTEAEQGTLKMSRIPG